MNEITVKNTNFLDIYNRSYRLSAAVFMISNIIDQSEELRTKIKNLSLDIVSVSVNLKDIDLGCVKKAIIDLEKKSLELMSMLDIASVAGLISKMNASILKEEFQLFISELGKFSEKFESGNLSVKNVFEQPQILNVNFLEKADVKHPYVSNIPSNVGEIKNAVANDHKNNNGHRRKDQRKNAIMEFIKGHNDVSIKDIVPNITGCSEKTVQRELISLINEGKIKKAGERRWSRYSIIRN